LRTLPHSELGSEFTYTLVGRAISLRLLPKSDVSSSKIPYFICNFRALAHSIGSRAIFEEHDTQRNRRMVAHVVKLMATKEDLADLKHDLKRDIASLHA
jgi:hypothetical protein